MKLFRSEAVKSSRAEITISIARKRDPYGTLITVIISTIFIVAMAFLFSGSYSRNTTVQGQIVADQGASEIVSPRQSIIKSVLVSEGDKVKKGQILASLVSDTSNDKGIEHSREQIDNIDRQILIDKSEINAIGAQDSVDSVATGRSVASLIAESSVIKQEALVQKKVVETLGSEMQALSSLDKKGFISKLDYHNREQQLASATEDLTRIDRDEMENSQSQISTMRARNASKADNASRIASLRRDILDLAEKRADITSSSGFTLTSPHDGELAEIRMHPGQSVKPTDRLAVITPKNYSPIAEIYLPTDAVAFVHVGQRISIMYDAFPYQTYGTFPGKITAIAKASIPETDVAPAAKSSEPVYIAKVSVRSKTVDVGGETRSLRSGMTLSAAIPLNHITFFEWLTSSITGVQQRSRFR